MQLVIDWLVQLDSTSKVWIGVISVLFFVIVIWFGENSKCKSVSVFMNVLMLFYYMLMLSLFLFFLWSTFDSFQKGKTKQVEIGLLLSAVVGMYVFKNAVDLEKESRSENKALNNKFLSGVVRLLIIIHNVLAVVILGLLFWLTFYAFQNEGIKMIEASVIITAVMSIYVLKMVSRRVRNYRIKREAIEAEQIRKGYIE